MGQVFSTLYPQFPDLLPVIMGADSVETVAHMQRAEAPVEFAQLLRREYRVQTAWHERLQHRVMLSKATVEIAEINWVSLSLPFQIRISHDFSRERVVFSPSVANPVRRRF